MERIHRALTITHANGAINTGPRRIRTGYPHIQRRQATRKGRRSENISRAERWMRGYQSERLELGARVTCGRRSVQLIAGIVVPDDGIRATQRVSGRGVQQGNATTPANSRLVRASGAETQPHGRDKFDRSERRPNVQHALPQPLMTAFRVRDLFEAPDVGPTARLAWRVGERSAEATIH